MAWNVKTVSPGRSGSYELAGLGLLLLLLLVLLLLFRSEKVWVGLVGVWRKVNAHMQDAGVQVVCGRWMIIGVKTDWLRRDSHGHQVPGAPISARGCPTWTLLQ